MFVFFLFSATTVFAAGGRIFTRAIVSKKIRAFHDVFSSLKARIFFEIQARGNFSRLRRKRACGERTYGDITP
jgi:hypothetical protein